MKEYKIKILGLDCPNCAAKLERALANNINLKDVSLSFVNKTLTFKVEDNVSFDSALIVIKKIINKVEPDAYIDEENSDTHEHDHHHSCECCSGHEHSDEDDCSIEHHHSHEHDHSHSHEHDHSHSHEHNHSHNDNNNKIINLVFMGLSIVCLIIGIIIETNSSSLNSFSPISIVFFLISYLFISYDILYKSFKNIIRGQIFDENFLMAIASIGAIILNEFHEAILVIFLYKLGELFQDYAINNSHRSIKNLLELQPKSANVFKNNEIIVVKPEDVKVDDILVVKPGEKVPVDGIIIEGSTSFDTSGISGESKPIDLSVNDDVSSGFINLSSLIKVKVTKLYCDSNISKMLKMIEESQDKKSNNEKFITKFAKYYTPIVVLLAFLIVLIPSLLHQVIPNVIKDSFDEWLYKGLVFLVVSCPCALVISIPLTFFGGVGRCSKSGILVKGSNYLERMSKVDTIVFDKTGTLTKGNFVISKIISELDENEILKYAYLCDYYSNHPIAQAIKERAKNIEIDISLISETINLGGLGIKAIIDNKVAIVGNAKLMEEHNIDYIPTSEIGTIVYVAYDNKFLGTLIIKDEIKDNVKEVISKIHHQGINTLMLSGDNEEVCKEVVELLEIKKYKSNLLPLDKVDELNKVLNNKKLKHYVVFVGDGVNDAPSLVNADVGISMGGLGSDVAIESSDIVINDDSLDKVNTLIKISKATTRIVKQNIIFSIGVKVVIMILTLFGITNMLLGIFADVGVMILAVLNSIRILSIKS